ncbi:MAG: hypothetical protein ACKO3P_00490 [Planctomycetaceae bacterium]
MEIEETPDRLRIVERGWELLFERTLDRWTQRLSGANLGVVCSVEGTTEDLAPPSPAFQELLCERMSAALCEVQLFGRAGQGVYSAAVRVDAERGEIAFDVFVRGKQADKPLGRGSTYQWEETAGKPGTPSAPAEGVFVQGRAIRFSDCSISFPITNHPATHERNRRQTRLRAP